MRLPSGILVGIVACVFIGCCSISIAAQGTADPPSISWTAFSYWDRETYPSSWLEHSYLEVDSLANVYAVGSIPFDLGASPPWEGITLITKWSSTGELVWSNTYEDPDIYHAAHGTTMDARNNLYVVGTNNPAGGTAWPDWLISKISPSGEHIASYAGDDSAWRELYSADIAMDGSLYVCGTVWGDGVLVGRFDLDSGVFDWLEGYWLSPSTPNQESGIKGALDRAGNYFFAKNVNTADGKAVTVVARLDASTGNLDSSNSFDFGVGKVETVTGLDVDRDGNVVGVVWFLDSSNATLFKLDPDLNLLWSLPFETTDHSYICPRDLALSSDGRIYVSGRVGETTAWWQSGDESHMFTLCASLAGSLTWFDVFDPGGDTEREAGVADGVACAPDSTQTFVVGTTSHSGTGWIRSMFVLAYEKTVADTPAVFRVESLSGDVDADGTVHASSFATASADIAEWYCVSEEVDPADVLVHSATNPGCLARSFAPLSPSVAGVVSTKPGLTLGNERVGGENLALLALKGIVPVKVTDEGGAILPGDLLVSSSTPGHAMRWSAAEPCSCALVGKALEPMNQDSGVILVLLTAH